MGRLEHMLSEYRKQNNLGQKQFASRLGLTREYYAMIEEGRRVPTHTLLVKIAVLLGVSVCDICPERDGLKPENEGWWGHWTRVNVNRFL